jgi:CelD/BcsL family acetyltransferase involved in cellulose biosynthesis
VLRAILNFLAGSTNQWDELHVSAINTNNKLCDLVSQPFAQVKAHLVKESAVPIVDLRHLRESSADYLSQLRSNARSQIRRAMRQHEQFGKLEIDHPETAADALQFFDELKRMHQAYWQVRGEPGAFGGDFCDRFHRTLIAKRWPLGEIQLLRVRAGSRVVGTLYNFVHRGRVLFYQSGIDYDGDPKLKPGLVCQVMAVQHNLQLGADVYDFLAGASQYKQSLSTNSELLRWFVWQRPRWRFRVENWLRDTKRKFVSLSRLA